MVPRAAHLPGQPQHPVDGDGQAALDAAVGVAVRVLAQDSRHHANAQDDEGEADQPLGPVIQALRKAHVQLQDGNAQRGHREGVAEGVGHAQAQSATPVALHGSDVGDGRQMVIIEAMAQPQDQAGAERGIEFPVAEDG